MPGVASRPAAESDQVVKAVFLDRDGVLNANLERAGKPVAPVRLEELQLLDGAVSSVRALKAAGFLTIVVTNQPDVVTGLTPKVNVEAINREIARAMPIDAFFVCYHTDANNCSCRKPKPGLILAAAKAHNIDLPSSYLVGDRWRDIEAGQAAGCKTILVDNGYPQERPTQHSVMVSSLPEAVKWIMRSEGRIS